MSEPDALEPEPVAPVESPDMDDCPADAPDADACPGDACPETPDAVDGSDLDD